MIINLEEIKNLIPHRHPFLFADKCKIIEPGKKGISERYLSENDYFFAGRPHLQCDLLLKSNNQKLSIINLHMKCCDSGLNRRKLAAEQLYNYLNNHLNKSLSNQFIVLGDWNDDLKDEPGEHCFDLFLNDG